MASVPVGSAFRPYPSPIIVSRQPQSLASLSPANLDAPLPAVSGPGHAVAVLLPLSGPLADRGQGMLQAIQLAFGAPGSPPLDIKDTAGNPQTAATAAQQAIAAGDALIVGPYSASETAAVSGPARAANVPVLAFTSDPSQAQPGVWVLGLTPDQQVNRLVAAAAAAGMGRFAALLPDNALGRAMGDALGTALAATANPPPRIVRYANDMGSMNVAVRDVADYAVRRGPIDAKIHAARALNNAEGRREVAELSRSAVPPPPFDCLLLADTGTPLAEVATLLPYYDIDTPPVHIMGPALWGAAAARAGAGAALSGARFAAPDPAARSGFDASFNAKYGIPSPPLADLAYDGGLLARAAVQSGGDPVAELTRPDGFVGADGVLGLLPNGHVRRSLAIFQIDGSSATMVDPAPQNLEGPGT
jgi:ABC-type branched-subunit amino acid transport system substrate-binding protein